MVSMIYTYDYDSLRHGLNPYLPSNVTDSVSGSSCDPPKSTLLAAKWFQLSQTSSAFIANMDDHIYSISQTSCPQFVPITGDFSSEGSQSYMAPSSHVGLDFDVKPILVSHLFLF